jgi:hypothetical protein
MRSRRFIRRRFIIRWDLIGVVDGRGWEVEGRGRDREVEIMGRGD